MGFLGDIGKGLLDFGKQMVGPLASSALSFGGDYLTDAFIGDANAKEAYERQKKFYQHRYQWMMDDMEKAGLNPILAAASGGFSTSGTPSVNMATLPKTDYASAYESYQRGGLIGEETKTEQVEQMKKMAEVKTEIQRKYEVRASAGLAGAKEKEAIAQMQKSWVEINKIRSEVKVLSREKERVAAEVQKLRYSLSELRTISNIYEKEAGQYLQVLKQIMQGLNIGVGIVPRLGGR